MHGFAPSGAALLVVASSGASGNAACPHWFTLSIIIKGRTVCSELIEVYSAWWALPLLVASVRCLGLQSPPYRVWCVAMDAAGAAANGAADQAE